MGKGKWPVLHDKPTITSLHHSVHAPRLSSPADALDIHLISCYQHNLEVFPETSDTMRHPRRLETSHQGEMSSNEDTAPHTIIHGGVCARPSIHSVKLGIGANHIAQTIAGFSRKVDGTFYNL